MVRGIEETGTGRALGLPDDAFEQRRPLKGQITKRRYGRSACTPLD